MSKIDNIFVQLVIGGFYSAGKIRVDDIKNIKNKVARQILTNIATIGLVASDENIEEIFDFDIETFHVSERDAKKIKDQISTLSKEERKSFEDEACLYFADNEDETSHFNEIELLHISDVLEPLSKSLKDVIDENVLIEAYESKKVGKNSVKVLHIIKSY